MTLQTTNLDSKLKHADPIIAGILNDALSEKEIDIKDSVMLFSAKGIELELVCSVADELRKRRVGDVVTYVVNRNINFTNVCIKQCGFCAFSRDFREEEGYLLPIEEIVRRAKEAHELGATEVCIQAGLPPDMDGELYEKICREIKKEIPKMHIHGFSPGVFGQIDWMSLIVTFWVNFPLIWKYHSIFHNNFHRLLYEW